MKAVVTVTGTDRRGIIAEVSTFLSRNNINILDISQTIMGDQFAMIMVTDTAACEKSFAALAEELSALGKSIDMSIRIQHEDIFNAMHSV